MKKQLIHWISILFLLFFPALPSSAEWLADIYAGAAFTQKEDLIRHRRFPTLTVNLSGQLGVETFETKGKFDNLDFDTTTAFGGRFGYWFETRFPLGLALDIFHFQPDTPSQTGTDFLSPPFQTGVNTLDAQLPPLDLAVAAISFDLMFRWPLLRSQAFPQGQLQPYLTMGPTLFITGVEEVIFGDLGAQTGLKRSDTDFSPGVKAGAGLAWPFHPHFTLFGEYRFTHFRPDFSFRVRGSGVLENVDSVSTQETALNSHHLFVGLSFRF